MIYPTNHNLSGVSVSARKYVFFRALPEISEKFRLRFNKLFLHTRKRQGSLKYDCNLLKIHVPETPWNIQKCNINMILLYILNFYKTIFSLNVFFLSFRQNTSIVYIDICRINECNQNMLTFIKYTYGTTCFNYTYLLIFILSMITSKHKMRHKSFVQCSRYYTALLCTAISYKEKPIHRNNTTD